MANPGTDGTAVLRAIAQTRRRLADIATERERTGLKASSSLAVMEYADGSLGIECFLTLTDDADRETQWFGWAKNRPDRTEWVVQRTAEIGMLVEGEVKNLGGAELHDVSLPNLASLAAGLPHLIDELLALDPRKG